MKGDLDLPEAKAGGKLPVVLILHGSTGIDGRGGFHGMALNAAGIGTLEIFIVSRGNRQRAGKSPSNGRFWQSKISWLGRLTVYLISHWCGWLGKSGTT